MFVKYVATFLNGAGTWRRGSKRTYTHAWAVYTRDLPNGLGGGGFSASYELARKAADAQMARAVRNDAFKPTGSEIVPVVIENPRQTRGANPTAVVKHVSVQQRGGIHVGKVYPLEGRGLARVRSIHRYGAGAWLARVLVGGAEESVPLKALDSANVVRPVPGYAVGPGPIRRRKLNPSPPRTVEEAHAAGRSDGAQGLGPIAPPAGPLRDAYMQSYRDALVARVGVTERRRRNPRKRGKTVTTTTRATVIRRTNPKDPAGMQGSEINRELDRLDAASSKLTSELIAAGRGHEKMWDTLKLTDPLAMRARASFARSSALRHEIERRYGPGAPHRLPRGFGPIRNINPRKRGKTVTTTTRATVIRRTNRRMPPRALVVLYAHRPGKRRLKYLGRGKFGERGRAMLFKSVASADLAAWILRDSHPQALRGWTLKAE